MTEVSEASNYLKANNRCAPATMMRWKSAYI